MSKKIDISNDWNKFKFGDKITFSDTGYNERYLNKEFIFIELAGEDYMFYDPIAKDTEHIRAYYVKECIKVKEEQVLSTTYHITD